MHYTNINSHETACEFLHRSIQMPDVSMRPEDQQGSILATIMLMDIADAINKADDNYKPQVNDWRPRFSNSSFTCTGSDYGFKASSAEVGSSSCYRFRTQAISDYFGKRFNHIHKCALRVKISK